MILDVWLCESSGFLMSLIVIILDEYNVWKNVLPLFRLTSLLIFKFWIFQVILAFLNILIITSLLIQLCIKIIWNSLMLIITKSLLIIL
jgi:hypothetical protein